MCLHTCPAAIPLPFRFLRCREPGAGNIVCGVMPYFSARPGWEQHVGLVLEGDCGIQEVLSSMYHSNIFRVYANLTSEDFLEKINKYKFDQCTVAPEKNFKTSVQSQIKPNPPTTVEEMSIPSL